MIAEIAHTTVDSPVGRIFLARSNDGFTRILFEKNGRRIPPAKDSEHDPARLHDAIEQLEQYFAGQRTEFDLPLAPDGTSFQRRVWKELRGIPYGTTATYGEIARLIGLPEASRAVGAANGRNPLAIVVPCHRVIGANGKLTGYAGGLPTKKFLLEHEERIAGPRGRQLSLVDGD